MTQGYISSVLRLFSHHLLEMVHLDKDSTHKVLNEPCFGAHMDVKVELEVDLTMFLFFKYFHY